MKTIKQIFTWIIGLVLSLFAAYYLYSYHQEFLNFGIALVLMILGGLILWCIDKFILVGYDLVDEIKKDNRTVGMALIAFAIVLGSCIISAFIVYK